MAKNRIERDTETRENGTRKKAWQRPETLPVPKDKPGYQYRWIRVGSLGTTDATNISSKIREGWTAVKAEDHPEITLVQVEHERFKDNIVVGGLMLCTAPVELVEERSDYYKEQTRRQMESVDNNLMRESDPRMPIFNERKSKVTFGNGT